MSDKTVSPTKPAALTHARTRGLLEQAVEWCRLKLESGESFTVLLATHHPDGPRLTAYLQNELGEALAQSETDLLAELSDAEAYVICYLEQNLIRFVWRTPASETASDLRLTGLGENRLRQDYGFAPTSADFAPMSGQASSVQGELIRAFDKLHHEAMRNSRRATIRAASPASTPLYTTAFRRTSPTT